MFLPLISPSLHQVLKQSSQPWELLSDEGGIYELQKLEVLFAIEVFNEGKDLIVWSSLNCDNICNMVPNVVVFIDWLLSLLLFLSQFFIAGADVLDELDDSFEVIVVDAVFDLVLSAEGVVSFEEGIEQLGNAIFHRFLLKDPLQYQLSNKFDVAQNVLLLVLEEDLLVLWRLELGELVDFLVEGVLDSIDEEVFEWIVLLALLFLLGTLELEFVALEFGEVVTKFGVCACVFGLIPSLLDDFFNEDLANIDVVEEVRNDVNLDGCEVLWDNQVEVVNDFLLALFDMVQRLILLCLQSVKVLSCHVLNVLLHLASFKGLVFTNGDLHT